MLSVFSKNIMQRKQVLCSSLSAIKPIAFSQPQMHLLQNQMRLFAVQR